MKLSIENLNINHRIEKFYAYIIEHNKKYDYYLLKCAFKLIFFDNQHFLYIMSDLFTNRTMCSWYRFLEILTIDFKHEGYNFNHIAEMNIITIVNKRDMSYDFYIKHNMCALEWKLNDMINRDKTVINKFDRNWRRPLNRKYKSYRDLII